MRVAFFVWSFPIGSETFVLNLARAAIEAGASLDIYSIRTASPSETLDHPVIRQFDLSARHACARLPRSLAARLLGAPRALARAVRRHGVAGALRVLPPFSLRRDVFSLRALYAAAALRARDYDLIHCQFASIAPIAILLREAGLLRGRLIVHVRGADVTRRSDPSRLAGYRRVFDRADAVIANSRHFRDAAVAAGCPAEKIVVIPSATDLVAFPYRPPRPVGDRRARLVSVGRLVEKKGLPYALEATAMLLREGRDVELEIIGDGPLRRELEERAAALGLGARAIFRGARPSDEVQRALAAADVFVASSVTASDGDQDAATNTVKEAMATGAPVVATAHGGMPEMVVDGVTGLLVPERDSRALADAIARLLDSPELVEPMTRAARDKIAAEVSREVLDRRLIALYEDVAAARGPAARAP